MAQIKTKQKPINYHIEVAYNDRQFIEWNLNLKTKSNNTKRILINKLQINYSSHKNATWDNIT